MCLSVLLHAELFLPPCCSSSSNPWLSSSLFVRSFGPKTSPSPSPPPSPRHPNPATLEPNRRKAAVWFSSLRVRPLRRWFPTDTSPGAPSSPKQGATGDWVLASSSRPPPAGSRGPWSSSWAAPSSGPFPRSPTGLISWETIERFDFDVFCDELDGGVAS